MALVAARGAGSFSLLELVEAVHSPLLRGVGAGFGLSCAGAVGPFGLDVTGFFFPTISSWFALRFSLPTPRFHPPPLGAYPGLRDLSDCLPGFLFFSCRGRSAYREFFFVLFLPHEYLSWSSKSHGFCLLPCWHRFPPSDKIERYIFGGTPFFLSDISLFLLLGVFLFFFRFIMLSPNQPVSVWFSFVGDCFSVFAMTMKIRPLNFFFFFFTCVHFPQFSLFIHFPFSLKRVGFSSPFCRDSGFLPLSRFLPRSLFLSPSVSSPWTTFIGRSPAF